MHIQCIKVRWIVQGMDQRAIEGVMYHGAITAAANCLSITFSLCLKLSNNDIYSLLCIHSVCNNHSH